MAAKVTNDLWLEGAEPQNHYAERGGRGWALLGLSFSALGVIYGDIGTSPLYSYQAVFTAPPDEQRVLSAASLFFWTLTLIVLVKYVAIVLRFDDNGEGGTFALYSLICRAAGFGPFGKAQPVDMHFKGTVASVLKILPPHLTRGHFWSLQTESCGRLMRSWYRSSRAAQVSLLVVVMVATAMVVGDGVLTPSISVLSAISGLQEATTAITKPAIVGITIAVLVILFGVQHLGTGRISMVFAPVITVWLLFNAALGFYNLSACGWGVWKALSPQYAIYAFTREGGFYSGWQLLAGVMLCITGAEAMYADIGHFSARAVMLSFCGFVYPCLVVTYMGQAAYLIAHPDAYVDPFWKSVPPGAFWPMLVVATAASVVASQALISGVFSIMRQAMMLGVLPRLKITHTDEAAEGQIYIGQLNYMLMLGCIAMVAGFQDTTALGHAYGVAVITVMFMTTILSGLVMMVCYDINPALVFLFVIFFVPLEGLFLSSNAIKIPEGGWVTLMIAALVASLKLIWWYGSLEKRQWLIAQSQRNKAMLTQLPLEDEEHEQSATFTQEQLQPPIKTFPESSRSQVSSLAAQSSPLLYDNKDWACSSSNTLSNGPDRPDGLNPSCSNGLPAPRKQRVVKAIDDPSNDWDAATPGGSSALHFEDAKRHRLASHSAPGRALASLSRSTTMAFNDQPLARLPGMAIVYSTSTSGIPAVLRHLLTNMPALHRVTVLLNIRFTPLPYIIEDERFLVRKTSLPGVYRAIVRYGYMEAPNHGPEFVRRLVGCLIRHVAGLSLQPHQQQQQQQNNTGDSQAMSSSSAATQRLDITASGGGLAAAAGARDPPTIIEMPSIKLPAAEAGNGGQDPAGASAAEVLWQGVSITPADEAVLSAVSLSADGGEPQIAAATLLSRLSKPVTTSSPSPTASPKQQQLPQFRLQHQPLQLRQLGRESMNRWQHRQQRRRLERSSTEPPLAVASWGGGYEGSQRMGAESAAGHVVSSHARSSDGFRQSSVAGGRQGADQQQLEEVGLLLQCYRHPLCTVSIVGGTRVVGAKPGSNLLRSGVIMAYEFLANIRQPATVAWQLLDEQLLEVTMDVRL